MTICNRQSLMVTLILSGLLAFSSPASARHHYHDNYNRSFSITIGPSYSTSYYNRCYYTGGYWNRGYWVPVRKVCNYYDGYRYRTHCYWTGGFWRYGEWYPRHKVCR